VSLASCPKERRRAATLPGGERATDNRHTRQTPLPTGGAVLPRIGAPRPGDAGVGRLGAGRYRRERTSLGQAVSAGPTLRRHPGLLREATDDTIRAPERGETTGGMQRAIGSDGGVRLPATPSEMPPAWRGVRAPPVPVGQSPRSPHPGGDPVARRPADPPT